MTQPRISCIHHHPYFHFAPTPYLGKPTPKAKEIERGGAALYSRKGNEGIGAALARRLLCSAVSPACPIFARPLPCLGLPAAMPWAALPCLTPYLHL